jgi:plasmid maintenance system antidote protein VapI
MGRSEDNQLCFTIFCVNLIDELSQRQNGVARVVKIAKVQVSAAVNGGARVNAGRLILRSLYLHADK